MNLREKIIEEYRKWRSEHDEDYCYDEIFDFLDRQKRGDMLRFMDEVSDYHDALLKKLQ